MTSSRTEQWFVDAEKLLREVSLLLEDDDFARKVRNLSGELGDLRVDLEQLGHFAGALKAELYERSASGPRKKTVGAVAARIGTALVSLAVVAGGVGQAYEAIHSGHGHAVAVTVQCEFPDAVPGLPPQSVGSVGGIESEERVAKPTIVQSLPGTPVPSPPPVEEQSTIAGAFGTQAFGEGTFGGGAVTPPGLVSDDGSWKWLLEDYDDLSETEILQRLAVLTRNDLEWLLSHENSNLQRATILGEATRRLEDARRTYETHDTDS